MPKKPNTRGSAGKAKAPKETQKAQSARFIETARTVGVDESGKEFDRAIKRIVPARSPAKSR